MLGKEYLLMYLSPALAITYAAFYLLSPLFPIEEITGLVATPVLIAIGYVISALLHFTRYQRYWTALTEELAHVRYPNHIEERAKNYVVLSISTAHFIYATLLSTLAVFWIDYEKLIPMFRGSGSLHLPELLRIGLVGASNFVLYFSHIRFRFEAHELLSDAHRRMSIEQKDTPEHSPHVFLIGGPPLIHKLGKHFLLRKKHVLRRRFTALDHHHLLELVFDYSTDLDKAMDTFFELRHRLRKTQGEEKRLSFAKDLDVPDQVVEQVKKKLREEEEGNLLQFVDFDQRLYGSILPHAIRRLNGSIESPRDGAYVISLAPAVKFKELAVKCLLTLESAQSLLRAERVLIESALQVVRAYRFLEELHYEADHAGLGVSELMHGKSKGHIFRGQYQRLASDMVKDYLTKQLDAFFAGKAFAGFEREYDLSKVEARTWTDLLETAYELTGFFMKVRDFLHSIEQILGEVVDSAVTRWIMRRRIRRKVRTCGIDPVRSTVIVLRDMRFVHTNHLETLSALQRSWSEKLVQHELGVVCSDEL